MADSRRVQHCRWAQPTLFLAGPLWAHAEDCPWSCDADGAPRLIEDTEVCGACGRWAPAADANIDLKSAWRAWPALAR
jgi:hypothetical protein